MHPHRKSNLLFYVKSRGSNSGRYLASTTCIDVFNFAWPSISRSLEFIQYLRKYEVIEQDQNRQDGWTVEVRKRKSGKLQGGVYKVFIDPKGVKFYSKTKAELAGMAKSSSPKAHPKPKAKGRDKKKQKQA